MKKSLASIAVLTLMGIPAMSHASMVDEIVSFSATGDGTSDTSSVNFWWNTTATTDTYTLANPVELGDLGTLDTLSVEVDSDPAVKLNFNFSSAGSPTTFAISAPALTFAGIVNPQAFASASITLTDNSGDSSGNYTGGAVTGTIPGAPGQSYEADYNGSTDYADLLPSFTGTPAASVTESGRSPGTGFNVIPATVSSISSTYNFLLSANQSASGTSNFSVNVNLPEPTTAAIALVASSAGLLRRRRKNLKVLPSEIF